MQNEQNEQSQNITSCNHNTSFCPCMEEAEAQLYGRCNHRVLSYRAYGYSRVFGASPDTVFFFSCDDCGMEVDDEEVIRNRESLTFRGGVSEIQE